MNVEDYIWNERLKVYGKLMSRLRWLAASSILIATFGLVHVLNENLSYTSHQLKAINAYRIQAHHSKGISSKLNKTKKWLLEYPSNSDSLEKYQQWHNILALELGHDSSNHELAIRDYDSIFWNTLSTYSSAAFNVNYTDNTLKNSSHEKIEIPLIGYKVYGNDFILIQIGLLLFFVLGVYLSLRSILGIIKEVSTNDSRIMKLFEMHFTFLRGTTNKIVSINLAEILFFSYPLIAVVIIFWMECTLGGLWDSLNFSKTQGSKTWDSSGFAGAYTPLFFRFFFISMSILVLTYSTFKIIRLIRNINLRIAT